MGMVLGWISWPALLWGAVLGFVIAALVSLALLAARRATRKSDVPFGPSMLAGAWIIIAASGVLPL
jgi:leader peptidase (prepilin peptidase)/N-methyltransferase